MTYWKGKDGDGNDIYHGATGAGTTGDPYLSKSADGDAMVEVLGDIDDAAVAAGAVGSLSAKLRLATTLLDDLNTVLGATDDAAATAGGEGTQAAKLRLATTLLDDLNTVLGATDDAAATAGGEGTQAAKLRLATTLLDAMSTVEGATDDAAATAGGEGSHAAKLRLVTTQLAAIAASAAGLDEKTVVMKSGTVSASGDNTLLAAQGAGVQVVLVALVIQNESSTATTMILKDSSTEIARNLAQNKGDGLWLSYPAVDARPKMTANTALVVNLSGPNQFGYSLAYYTES